nr:MAG TPA: hypothetical protein [Caudoviricetes sp.]
MLRVLVGIARICSGFYLVPLAWNRLEVTWTF